MKAGIFETVLDGAIYRKNHGGWLFIKSDSLLSSECYWFDASEYTASSVMLHSLTKGKSGELVCDNRYIK